MPSCLLDGVSLTAGIGGLGDVVNGLSSKMLPSKSEEELLEISITGEQLDITPDSEKLD